MNDKPAPRRVSVLGSTGSIGVSTVDLLKAGADGFRVEALVGGRNDALLAEQAIAVGARCAVIADDSRLGALRERLAGHDIEVASGARAVIEAASRPVDWTMAAITGAVGLGPTLAAIRGGGAVALANKEALVSAGTLMLDAVRDAGGVLLPVDSEHNAIFQALGGRFDLGAVERITLTASGGPFRTATLEAMRDAGPADALKHPTWSMGAKISIDSATMFNKGLEIIEAARLFGLPGDRIEVLVHPQSVVHGMVHFEDASVVAQLGAPDMRIPIAHCLAWPARLRSASPRLDLAAIGRLEFEAPDETRFPALRLAREALRQGAGSPTVLNAGNEVAVAAFLDGRIGFLDIASLVERVMQTLGSPPISSLDDVLALDAETRRQTERLIRR